MTNRGIVWFAALVLQLNRVSAIARQNEDVSLLDMHGTPADRPHRSALAPEDGIGLLERQYV